MAIRRDYTNASGAFDPTANSVIQAEDRERYAAEGWAFPKPHSGVLREKQLQRISTPTPPPAEAYKAGLKRARQIKLALQTIAAAADLEFTGKLALKDKRTGQVYEEGDL